MIVFETFEDVEAWLEPLGYDAFWDAILPTGALGPEDRAHCDQTLADGVSDMDTVARVVKRMALFELVAQHDLPFRCDKPHVADLRVVS
ncbi:hypothetical protein [uncultured Roseobacter sp.]|uniref:hypothetical protein n=1 Tax=uncultured Roseobacter sp. TaxID=114847 RepID=UPI0026207CF5|nr:hypothetical protein [uncultured Roseobacter sp.]